MRTIIGCCVRFRLLALAVAAAVMVLGILRLSQMPVDAVPENTPVAVDVETAAAGLSAPQVESLVTVPLDKHLMKHVPGVTGSTSDSVAGLSAIELRFAPGTDPDHARELVREHLTRLIAVPGVSEPVVPAPAPMGSAIMLIGLTSGNLSPTGLSVLARAAIVPRLLALPGVSDVSAFGQAGQQLTVLVDPARLAARHVTLGQVLRTAGDAQPVPPVSYRYAPGAGGSRAGPGQPVSIQPVVPFGTAAALARLPVAGAAGRPRLGDVARVAGGSQPPAGEPGPAGSPGLVLVVQKSPSAGVPAVSREVDQAVAALQPRLPGVSIDDSLFREDTYLRGALGNLQGALVAAGVLAALALLALLVQLRLTCAALISAGLSLVAATALLALLGYTFNALVTLGLLLALALVVTEAAAEVQAIAARIEPGGARTARTARLIAAACADMRGTLTWGGLAAALCVAPLLPVTGPTGALLRPMAMAFALTVIVSLVVAVTVTPALAAVLLTVVPPQIHGRALPGELAAGYARLIAALTRARRAAVAGAVLSVAAGVAALAALPFLDPGQPAFGDRALIVSLTGPAGVSATGMGQLMANAAGEVSALPAVASVTATVGRPATSGQVVAGGTGRLWVTIKPDADYGRAVAAVQSIADGTPGLSGLVSTYESDNMAGALTAAPAEVVARLYGADYGELGRLAGRLRAVIAAIGGVSGTQVLPPVEQPTASVNVNPAAAARAGISPAEVRREAGALLNGITVGDYFGNQEVFDVLVAGTAAVRDNPRAASGLQLSTPGGGLVRLGRVARISVSREPGNIPQDAGSRYLDVTALVPGGQAGAVSAAIGGRLASTRFPPGYRAALVTGTAATGLSASGAGAAGTSRAAFAGYAVVALAGVALITVGATGSRRLAALAFCSLPVSLSGGLLVVFTVGVTGQLAASAGLLGVLALATRQAIAVTARAARGVELGTILTPALVTAVTLAPFAAMGDVPGMELLHTAAAVVLGGLATTTLVGLFVLPVAGRLLGPRLTLDPAAAAAATDGHRRQRVRARME